jgi:hypothetical protein
MTWFGESRILGRNQTPVRPDISAVRSIPEKGADSQGCWPFSAPAGRIG